MDVDGDLLRSQLWNAQRGVMNSAGSGPGDGSAAGVAGGPRDAGGPLGGPLSNNNGMGSMNSVNKPKSMPHMALPYDLEFTRSGLGGPFQLEGNHPAAGAEKSAGTGMVI